MRSSGWRRRFALGTAGRCLDLFKCEFAAVARLRENVDCAGLAELDVVNIGGLHSRSGSDYYVIPDEGHAKPDVVAGLIGFYVPVALDVGAVNVDESAGNGG